MMHDQKWHIEVLSRIDPPGGGEAFHEPHPTPRLHKAVDPTLVAAGELPTTEDHAEATTYARRGELLVHLEQLREQHPDARFAIRHVVVNVEAWPPLVSGGYAPSPNDLRSLDLKEAKAAKAAREAE